MDSTRTANDILIFELCIMYIYYSIDRTILQLVLFQAEEPLCSFAGLAHKHLARVLLL